MNKGKSDWHHLWQSRVDSKNCELIIRDDLGKYHRADICHEKTVFEVQHSPIDEDTVMQRENFYRYHGYNLHWIVDATLISYYPFGHCFLIEIPNWILSMNQVWLDVGYGLLRIIEIKHFKKHHFAFCHYHSFKEFQDITKFCFNEEKPWYLQPYNIYQQSYQLVNHYTEEWMNRHPKSILECRSLLSRLSSLDPQIHSHFLWRMTLNQLGTCFNDYHEWMMVKWCKLFHIKKRKTYKNIESFIEWMKEYPMERCTQICPRIWYCKCPCEERTFLLVYLLHQGNTEDVIQKRHRHLIPTDFAISQDDFRILYAILPNQNRCETHQALSFDEWWKVQDKFIQSTEGYYYFEMDYQLETSILNKTREFIKNPKPIHVEDQLRHFWEALLVSRPMDENQVLFLEQVIKNPILCLTGKPGTGKTATLTCLLFCLYKAGISFVVSSFTGKALYRLKSSILETLKALKPNRTEYERFQTYIDEHVFTLHRLKTGMVEGVYQSKVLVIDEMSMVNAKLYYKALEKFDNLDRIVLSGDHNQLEPIGRGRTFDWMMKECPILDLRHCHRQKGTSILNSASNLLDGVISLETDEYFEYIQSDPIESVIRWSKLHPDGIVLSYTNQIVDRINDDLIEYHSKGLYDTIQFGKYFVGMKVIHTRKNIYDYKETSTSQPLNIMNGEEGVIHKIGKDSLRVKYPTKTIVYDFNEGSGHHPTIEYLKPAYAITIHKSQGSEWENVYVYLPYIPEKVGNRLVYTALTRAKTKCILNSPSYSLQNLKC